MTCAELREQAAAYALGALEPAERADVERHLAEPGPHEGCEEAVARAVATAAELAFALPVPEVRPDPGVWRAIEARTGAVPSVRPRRFARTLAWAAAAAAVVLLVFHQRERLALRREREALQQAQAEAAAARQERDRVRAELLAQEGAAAPQRDALALLDRPGTRLVSLEPQPGQRGRAVAILNRADGRAVIASSSLPVSPGKVYQLWVIRGAGPPRPAGFLQQGASGAAAGEVDRTLLAGAPPDALAVSREPLGGSPAPTEIVLVGRVTG